MATLPSGSGDLVGGGYPLISTFASYFAGNAFNATQSNIQGRTNAAWPLGALQDASAALTTADVVLVPVPVSIGDPISFVDVFVGATAASTPTHSWAALYSGTATTATLVGKQSTDSTTTAIPASTRLTYTLGQTYITNATDSPFGYLYVALAQTGTAVSSLVSGTVATAIQKAFYTGQPLLAASISATGATAPATITLASTAAQAAVPVVVLR